MVKTFIIIGFILVTTFHCKTDSESESSAKDATTLSAAQSCSCNTSYHYRDCNGSVASSMSFSNKGKCADNLIDQAIAYCCPGYETAKMNCDVSDIADAVKTSEIVYDCK